MKQIMQSTPMLDYEQENIRELIRRKGWRELDDYHQIREIYNFVRDEIRFGYNKDDVISASQVLADGYGQCNTKTTLFMALLRAVGIPCRAHGFIIDKGLQKGAMPGWIYALSPNDLVHSWAEVFYDGVWYDMEGLILDKPYLTQLQRRFEPDCGGGFCGYAVSVKDFKNPPIDWDKNSTYIQKEDIKRDLGVYDSPDALFAQHAQKIGRMKKWFFRNIARHAMNRQVRRIRG